MGLVRLLLASCVIASHCGGSILGVPFLPGRQAVLLFYVISGFYMALVLNEKYVGPASNRVFYANRYLRLWPSYLAVLVATLVAYGLFTERLAGFSGRIEGAQNSVALLAATAFSNLFIFGQDLFWFFSVDTASGAWAYAPVGLTDAHNGSKLLLNPPAFTVGIELLFYLLAPHFLRSYRRVVGVLALSVAYHWALGAWGLLSLAYSYHFFPATLLFFSLGGLVYWVFRRREGTDPRGYLLLGVLFGAILSARLVFPSFVTLIFALAVPGLFEMSKGLKVDRVLGDLSYPLYIAHWPVLTLLRPHVPEEILGGATLLLTLSVAGVLYLAIERPVERFRQRYGERQMRRLRAPPRTRGQVSDAPGRSNETAIPEERGMGQWEHERGAERIRTRFETLYSGNRREGSGVLTNLSSLGAMVDEATLFPQVGEQVRLHLLRDDGGEPVAVSGGVVRLTHAGFAVQFKEPSEAVRRLLEDLAGAADPSEDPPSSPDS